MNQNEIKTLRVTVKELRERADLLEKIVKAYEKTEDDKQLVLKEPNKTEQFILCYVKAFSHRYPGSKPELSGKVFGQIKTFLKDRPIERACDLIQAYLQMDDPWFMKKTHDFSTFMVNIQKVSVALDMGVEDPNDVMAQFSRKVRGNDTTKRIQE